MDMKEKFIKNSHRYFTQIVLNENGTTFTLNDVGNIMLSNKATDLKSSHPTTFYSKNLFKENDPMLGIRFFEIKNVTSFKVKPLPLKARYNRLKKKVIYYLTPPKRVIRITTFEGSLHQVEAKANELAKMKNVNILNTAISKGYSSYHSKEPFILVVTYSIIEKK